MTKEEKEAAKQLLETMEHTPIEKLPLFPGMEAVAEFVNGFNRPNNKPPYAVYVGNWRLALGGRWSKV